MLAMREGITNTQMYAQDSKELAVDPGLPLSLDEQHNAFTVQESSLT